MQYDNFGFLKENNGFPEVFRLIDMGIEQRETTGYHFDNRKRPLYHGYIFQYTLSGEGQYEYKNKTYRLPKGHGFFTKIPEDSSYGLDKQVIQPWVFMYIHFEGSGVEAFYNYYIESVGPVCQLPIKSEPIQLFMELHDALCKGLNYEPMEGSDRLSRFLHQLLVFVHKSGHVRSNHVANGLKLLDDQVSGSEGIDQVAFRLGISHAHFTRLFRKEMGMTPMDYLRNKRLQKGIQLLLNTNDSIESIAGQCGFTCGNYFSKVFHKRIGMNPNTYRQLNR